MAPAEIFNGPYKTELIHHGPWKNVDWFNNRRIHNEIVKIPPAEREETYYVRLQHQNW
jgi:transposase InsO family protein